MQKPVSYLFLSQTIPITGNAKYKKHCRPLKLFLCPHVLGLNASFAFISSCWERMTHQTTSTAHVKCWRRKNRFQDVVWVFCALPHLLIYQVRNILHLTKQLMLLICMQFAAYVFKTSFTLFSSHLFLSLSLVLFTYVTITSSRSCYNALSTRRTCILAMRWKL